MPGSPAPSRDTSGPTGVERDRTGAPVPGYLRSYRDSQGSDGSHPRARPPRALWGPAQLPRARRLQAGPGPALAPRPRPRTPQGRPAPCPGLPAPSPAQPGCPVPRHSRPDPGLRGSGLRVSGRLTQADPPARTIPTGRGGGRSGRGAAGFPAAHPGRRGEGAGAETAGQREEEAVRTAAPSRFSPPRSRGSPAPPGRGSDSARGRPVHRERAEPPQRQGGRPGGREYAPSPLSLPPGPPPRHRERALAGGRREPRAAATPARSGRFGSALRSQHPRLVRRSGAGLTASHVTAAAGPAQAQCAGGARAEATRGPSARPARRSAGPPPCAPAVSSPRPGPGSPLGAARTSTGRTSPAVAAGGAGPFPAPCARRSRPPEEQSPRSAGWALPCTAPLP